MRYCSAASFGRRELRIDLFAGGHDEHGFGDFFLFCFREPLDFADGVSESLIYGLLQLPANLA